MQVNYTLPIPDHWDINAIPWTAILGEEAHMDGGDGIITGVEIDAENRTFVLSVAPAELRLDQCHS